MARRDAHLAPEQPCKMGGMALTQHPDHLRAIGRREQQEPTCLLNEAGGNHVQRPAVRHLLQMAKASVALGAALFHSGNKAGSAQRLSSELIGF